MVSATLPSRMRLMPSLPWLPTATVLTSSYSAQSTMVRAGRPTTVSVANVAS